MSGTLQVLGAKDSHMAVEQRETTLARLEKERPEVLEMLKRTVGSADASNSIDSLSHALEKMSSQVRTLNTCQRILGTLAFDKMTCREESVHPAHANTFEWIFRDPKLGFTTWAQKKNGMSTLEPAVNCPSIMCVIRLTAR